VRKNEAKTPPGEPNGMIARFAPKDKGKGEDLDRKQFGRKNPSQRPEVFLWRNGEKSDTLRGSGLIRGGRPWVPGDVKIRVGGQGREELLHQGG